jgi:transposase
MRIDEIIERLADFDGLVARLALESATSIRDLVGRVNNLEREIKQLVKNLAPTLLARPGVGVLTAAKIVGETADVTRFKSKDAFARHNGTAPLPVWSGNRERFRLSRTGNRQLNCAIHRIAITQGRCHPEARTFIERRIALGNTRTEALRAFKRRLSDVVFRDLMTDTELTTREQLPRAA